MPNNTINSNTIEETDFFAEETYNPPCNVKMKLTMIGEVISNVTPKPNYQLISVFNGQILLDLKWQEGLDVKTDVVKLRISDNDCKYCLLDNPIVVLLRIIGKVSKEPDPFLNPDNRAGASLDLLPLLLGESEIFTKTKLVFMDTGEPSGCSVQVNITIETIMTEILNPLTITMISAHCLPLTKEGTVYVGALGLDRLSSQQAANFGLSLNSATTPHVIWANSHQLLYAASTGISVPEADFFVPPDLQIMSESSCNSVYWYSMKRVFVDYSNLAERVQLPFFITIAGVTNPRVSKKANDVRCCYMGMVDAKALLEPGIAGVTVCAKLTYYNEADIPEGYQPTLDLGTPSAKTTARDTAKELKDESEHDTYVKIRFDLLEPLNPVSDTRTLLERLKLSSLKPIYIEKPYELYVDPPPEDTTIDIHRIHKECGALAVHKELTSVTGPIGMPQSIKRNAASRLILRVRNMIKQFPPGDCSYSKWQDTVTHHHAASRRAVLSSFEPQPPPPRPSARYAATHAKILEDNRIANAHIEKNIKVVPNHPLSLLLKALRCLENRVDSEALEYLAKALNIQNTNRFLLWSYAAQLFDKGKENSEIAIAAMLLGVRGDYSDGTANAIGWAALHAIHHSCRNDYAAFAAALEMRYHFKLPKVWTDLLKRWEDATGRKEIYWVPDSVAQISPFLLAAAFFLCLRGYSLSSRLLKCYKDGCDNRGSSISNVITNCPDYHYVTAASWLLRRDARRSLKITETAIRHFGPSEILCQMRLTCLLMIHGWDKDCEQALYEAVSFNSHLTPALLLRSALNGMTQDPHVALQRATYAHKLQPSPHSALVVGRVYKCLDEIRLAERWAAQAVKLEPLLSNGWAFLALLALYQREVPKARALLRTAHEAGPISSDIMSELKQIMVATGVEELPETLVKKLCFCDVNY